MRGAIRITDELIDRVCYFVPACSAPVTVACSCSYVIDYYNGKPDPHKPCSVYVCDGRCLAGSFNTLLPTDQNISSVYPRKCASHPGTSTQDRHWTLSGTSCCAYAVAFSNESNQVQGITHLIGACRRVQYLQMKL